MADETPLQYHTTVFWLMRDASDSYRETWDLILDQYEVSARRDWCRAYPARSREANTSAIIFDAVVELQKKLLDETLSRLERNKTGSVTYLWPEWQKSGIPVELEEGGLQRIPAPFPADEQETMLPVANYRFKFFRTDTPKQRDRWFRHILKQVARSANRKPPVEFDQGTTEPIDLRALQNQLDARLLLRDLREIVDSRDYDWIAFDRHAANDAEAAEKSRALRNLNTAAEIIVRSAKHESARRFRVLLQKKRDGKRQGDLARYRTRFLDEKK